VELFVVPAASVVPALPNVRDKKLDAEASWVLDVGATTTSVAVTINKDIGATSARLTGARARKKDWFSAINEESSEVVGSAALRIQQQPSEHSLLYRSPHSTW
jgi:hypothetical protein